MPSDALVAATTTTSLLVGLTTDPVGDAVDESSGSFNEVAEAIGRALASIASPPGSTELVGDTGGATTLFATWADPESGLVAVVTPVGSSGLGVTTEAAVEGHSGVIDAMLPSGAIVTASVLSTGDGVAVVELPESEESTAVDLSETGSSGELTVMANGDPIVIDHSDLAALTVPEGSPIFDADGALIGLCSVGPDGTVEMLPITSLPDVTPPASIPGSGADAVESSPPPSGPVASEPAADETAVPSHPASSSAPSSTTSTTSPPSVPESSTEQGTDSTTPESEPHPSTTTAERPAR